MHARAESPHIPPGEVHVWRIDLDRPPGAPVLSEDERRRADRFLIPRVRDRFVAGRSALRTILASYLDALPAALAFSTSPQGKPHLVGGPEFNLSHSGGVAVLAVASGIRVGIDVEELREVYDVEALASRFFAESERRAILAAPAEEQRRMFFRVWTRKEAYLKALGLGLSAPLDGFEVDPLPTSPGRSGLLRPLAEDSGRWGLLDLDLGAGHLATLAAEGGSPAITSRDYHRGASPR